MKTIEKSLVEELNSDSTTTWSWSTEDEQSMLFRFDGQAASAEWSGATISQGWSKEIEKTLN